MSNRKFKNINRKTSKYYRFYSYKMFRDFSRCWNKNYKTRHVNIAKAKEIENRGK